MLIIFNAKNLSVICFFTNQGDSYGKRNRF